MGCDGLVQESVPDELRGRVMGPWTFTVGVCFPMGSQLMGLASEAEAEAAAERAMHTTKEGPAVTDTVGLCPGALALARRDHLPVPRGLRGSRPSSSGCSKPPARFYRSRGGGILKRDPAAS